MVEINEAERKKEKSIKRNEVNLRDLWDNVTCPDVTCRCHMSMSHVPIRHSNHRSPRRRRRQKESHEKIFEDIIVENFPKMGKEIVTQVQEAQKVPNRINPRLNTPRHILVKLTKIKHKEQILKAVREKQQITHEGIPIRINS